MNKVSLLLALFVFCTLAVADCPRDEYLAYNKMDRNGDGIITPQEFQVQAGETHHYLNKHGAQKRSYRTQHLDMNNDAWVDQNDYKEIGECVKMVALQVENYYNGCSVARMSAISRFDVNKDGVLSSAEKNAFSSALSAAILLNSQLNNRAPVYERYQIADLNNDGVFDLADHNIFQAALKEFTK